ncbi:TrbI F-type domain-containing protein [Escherichia coli]|uniref:TrbI F-type domain-containing protein n=1 Tax=Escherichia coli TaxID=562 RepID=UPI003EBD8B0C
MVLLNAASQLRHCQTERTGDCRLQHETDLWMHFLTAPVRNNCQKHSQKPFQRVLTRHWKPACRQWQQKHHAVILVSPAVVQGAPDITREIQQDIARRMRAEP